MIKALEKRLENLKAGENLPGRLCRELGTAKETMGYDMQEWKSFYPAEPILGFDHDQGSDRLSKIRKKWPWPVRAFDIPIWGRAEEIREKFQ